MPPQVIFAADDSVCINEEIEFVPSVQFKESDKNAKYLWDFGDGSTSESSKPIHKVFTKGGEYNVSFSVEYGIWHMLVKW